MNMGQISSPLPVLRIAAAFSRYPEALDWAEQRFVQRWGSVALASPRFEFHETEYYAPTMGSGILKCFWAFHPFVDPTQMPDWKIESNAWEDEYAALGRHPETRPLNIDPGYLTPAKLVLASTKDYAHRIYLSQGIYAEITLFYRHKQWQSHEFTFPDYRRADYQAFFTRCRQLL
jgi:hypothetical protein